VSVVVFLILRADVLRSAGAIVILLEGQFLILNFELTFLVVRILTNKKHGQN